ncbi:MAG: GAF domain-containing sensor histidine kinase [Thermoanaerobaculia bacterium]|nr:GAF domain-containing sensor histidine kinase [Thermoanaerobaculia bacterium]
MSRTSSPPIGPGSPDPAAPQEGATGRERPRRLTLSLIAALLLLFVLVEGLASRLAPGWTLSSSRLAVDLLLLASAAALVALAVRLMSRVNSRLQRTNAELLALHRAARSIHGELSLEAVLRRVVNQAAELLDARYGAIAVYDDEGRVQRFIVTGITPEEERAIGDPPRGAGLLGVPMSGSQRIRLRDISHDPRSAGMPPHHPPMHSLLAVPINCETPFRGNLYLAEKTTAAEFSLEDEDTVVRFANAAAIAVDNAYLHQQLRALAVAEERVRLAREMHDGMAQVLAYVNTKAQAVKEFLRRERIADASQQLEQLAEAAREVHVDVREQIVGLRTAIGPEEPLPRALERYLSAWQTQSGIAWTLECDDKVELSDMAELQLLRIVQESLSNVRKHAAARRVEVAVRTADGALEVSVADDGRGFDPAAKRRAELPRFGLAIMRERAESIGGRLSIESQRGGGTTVRVSLPVVDGPGQRTAAV